MRYKQRKIGIGASQADQLKSKIDPLHISFSYKTAVRFDFAKENPPVAIISFFIQV